MSQELWNEIINDTAELVRRSANRRGMLKVSPEVAAHFEAVEPVAELATEAPVRSLNDVEAHVNECTKCALASTRTNTVFGDGNPNADLLFVGEAPGGDEDAQGKPFVGKAGQLLTDIIEKGMKLKRSEVYICNVLKCRPPGNRDPQPEEVEQCEPYLIEQIERIKPRVICALGGHAARTLLRLPPETSVGKMRGKWHFYHGIPLRVTYHPAYLLRTPGDKRKTWMDVLEVLKVYNGEITPTPEP